MQAIVSETFVMFNLKQVSIRDFLISMMKKVSQCKQIQNAKSEWAMEKRQTQMCRLFDVHKKSCAYTWYTVHYLLSPAIKYIIHSFKGLQCKTNF